MSAEEVLIRDTGEIQPPEDTYNVVTETGATLNQYTHVEPPAFKACAEDIWKPNENEVVDDHKVVVKDRRLKQANAAAKVKVVAFLDSGFVMTIFSLFVMWSLFMDDVRIIAFYSDADVPISSINMAAMAAFGLECLLRSWVC